MHFLLIYKNYLLVRILIGLGCLMSLFNHFSAMHYYQFYSCRKPAYTEKTTDQLQVADKPYHIVIMLYRVLYTLSWAGFTLTTSVVIQKKNVGIDCIGTNVHVVVNQTSCMMVLSSNMNFS